MFSVRLSRISTSISSSMATMNTTLQAARSRYLSMMSGEFSRISQAPSSAAAMTRRAAIGSLHATNHRTP